MKPFILLIALLPLAACSSPEDRVQAAAQRGIDTCIQSGFQPNTPAFDDCRLQVSQRDERRKADRMATSGQIRDFQSNHPSR